MANELNYSDPFGTAGLTVYFQRWTAVGTVWNGSSHVAFVAANWATYKIAATGAGGGEYFADMPAAAAGAYTIRAFLQSGGTAASTDQRLGAGPIQWDGTAEVPLSSRLAPTVAGRTLDVSATGEAGLDWSNVGAPATTQTLANTTINIGAVSTTARTVTHDYLGDENLTITSKETGLPVPGAIVTAYLKAQYATLGASAPAIDSDTTDASGHWSLSLPAAVYTLTIALPSAPQTVVQVVDVTVT